MKKLIFTLFVALLATSLFTSCSDEKTDAEISADLSNHSYTGADAAGTYVLTLDAVNFKLIEPDGTDWRGTFNVVSGQLILTISTQDANPVTGKWALTVDGKSVFFKTWNGTAYAGAEVELKQQ